MLSAFRRAREHGDRLGPRAGHAATGGDSAGVGFDRAADVPIIYRCYDNLAHGFIAFTGAVPGAYVACREIAGLVREGLEGRIARAVG